jgi:hypothetical protein
MFGDIPSKWYKCNYKGLSYEITLGAKSPKEVLISIDDGNNYDSFTINLQPNNK